MKRIPLTARQARMLMAKQGGKCGAPGCTTVLITGPKGQHVNWIDEHRHALGRGGNNALKHRALYCIPCAKAKTFHPRSNATTLSSDIYEIKKTPRLKRKHAIHKPPLGAPRQEKMKSAWPKGRKLQSRPMRRTAP